MVQLYKISDLTFIDNGDGTFNHEKDKILKVAYTGIEEAGPADVFVLYFERLLPPGCEPAEGRGRGSQSSIIPRRTEPVETVGRTLWKCPGYAVASHRPSEYRCAC